MPAIRDVPLIGRQSRPLVESIGKFDIDFKRGNTLAAVHLDENLVRIEHHMARDHGEDLFPQNPHQIRLAAQSSFMCQKDLQPFPGNRRRAGAAADQA